MKIKDQKTGNKAAAGHVFSFSHAPILGALYSEWSSRIQLSARIVRAEFAGNITGILAVKEIPGQYISRRISPFT